MGLFLVKNFRYIAYSTVNLVLLKIKPFYHSCKATILKHYLYSVEALIEDTLFKARKRASANGRVACCSKLMHSLERRNAISLGLS